MKKTLISLVLLPTLMLGGCQTGGPKQTGGTMIGGLTGALAGSQFGKGKGQLVGVALGTMAGAMIGSSVGHSMDQTDKLMAERSTRNALETMPDNQRTSWKNPNNNHSGSIVVVKTVEKPKQKQVCRDYVQTVTLDGETEQVHGRACRYINDTRGEWIVQK